MEKEFKTMTYNSGVPLKLTTSTAPFHVHGVEVHARVDLDTGAVNLFIDPADLPRLREKE